jgi:hypothetical protein
MGGLKMIFFNYFPFLGASCGGIQTLELRIMSSVFFLPLSQIYWPCQWYGMAKGLVA